MNQTTPAASAVALPLGLAGCRSTAERMASTQPRAVQAAESRSRFELNCTSARGTVLVEEDLPPAVDVGRLRGPNRLLFAVGVAGRAKRATYTLVCPDNGSGNCFAVEGHR